MIVKLKELIESLEKLLKQDTLFHQMNPAKNDLSNKSKYNEKVDHEI